jgi:uncharacterized protein (TIGR03382 family)
VWVVLVLGIAIAALVYLISGGHVILLPLLLVFPLGWLFGRRRKRRG